MRLISLLVVCLCLPAIVDAHHPQPENQPIRPRIDVIGPLGSNLPISYRRRYNRPTNLGGKIAYHVAPSSQEAMAWHAATHRGDYERKRPRIEMHYFYPKPWETLRIGPRPKALTAKLQPQASSEMVRPEWDSALLDQSIAIESDRIEQ